MWQKNYDGSPILYLVATPIGNMEDTTFRAINVLKEVDVIFSEDTRVTRNLLNYFNINNKLISLHDHNEDLVKDVVLKYLVSGSSVAIVTDRGTPIISDPGYKTVKYVSEQGFRVVGLPGACAFVPALIMSITASASVRSILPLRNALLVNSPGSLSLAPAVSIAERVFFVLTRPPWQLISTVSSLV